MDFLDYQTFSVGDQNNLQDDTSLPEPTSRLDLSSIPTMAAQEREFKLPFIGAALKNAVGNTTSAASATSTAIASTSSTKKNDTTAAPSISRNIVDSTLYTKMSVYATKSIDTLTSSLSTSSENGVAFDNINSQIIDDHYNNIPLPNSNIPDNENDNEQKTKKDVTNLVLSKKLSRILNDYSINNDYNNTVKLRNSLKFLEEKKKSYNSNSNNEKLITPEYIGILARKTLRSDLENELLKEHIIVLEEFKPIVRRIKRFSSSVENISKISEQLIDRANETSNHGTTDSVFNQVEALQNQVNLLRLKHQLLTNIQKNFTLTQIEDDIIINGPIDLEFFKVINKVLKIKKNATFLLALDNMEPGTNLINQINSIIQIINKKIFNFLIDFVYDTSHINNGTNNNNNDNNNNNNNNSYSNVNDNVIIFQKSLIFLSNDLPYFDEFFKRVTSIRSKIILDEFLSQFELAHHHSSSSSHKNNSKTNSSDLNKPLILSAHDPIRYIGDVLASIHSIIANEADFIKSLFKFKQILQQEEAQEDAHNDSISYLQDKNLEFLTGLDLKLLNEIIQSLSNSIKLRIEQIIKFESNPITNFEILQLLKLYQMMFIKKGIKSNSSLINNLIILQNLSNDKIINSFTQFIDNVKESNQFALTTAATTGTNTTTTTHTAKKNISIKHNGNFGDDLLPPEWLSTYLSKITELFEEIDKRGTPFNDDAHDDDDDDTIATEDSHDVINQYNMERLIESPIFDVLMKEIKNTFPLAKKNESVKISLLTVQINCFDLINSRLQPFNHSRMIFSKSKNPNIHKILDKINDNLQQFIDTMKELQEKLLFEKTGLSIYNNLFNMIFPIDAVQDKLDYDMYQSLLDNPLMNIDTINNTVHTKLNEYLPNALNDIQENLLFKLNSPSIVDAICDHCFGKISLFYKIFRDVLFHLYANEDVKNANEKKQKISDILNFSSEEFNTLLGL
ncbi:Golgi transport complex subunit COG6 NDAI_0G00500 [Naumovozyma dairenensis CBS 421]|uniref:Conserved oligomeric Golgi complex subunit 6 n=1 Tax=Naumovozyma dairenensis (strain ATCC 10597 / BCRC 20456 / CBS 421 / NBRC 0211 / NRRL Y-12639) TaxID=1071378 RepID=G0WDG5_NAUDC|nr:hypothetical protein NDAI_0G00500 [Naumovozyma dairenensis CBS 421]CCD25826.2 hypothetical protein NDAI_0G00500 [Naumovozyma dairenensis CBS 421]